MHFKERLDPDAQAQQWKLQRAMWGVMAIIVALALLGVTGTGPISQAHFLIQEGGATVEAEYPKWNRQERPSFLTLRVHAPDAEGDRLRVILSYDLARGIILRNFMPPPLETALGELGQSYVFRVDDWTEPLVVVAEYAPERIGAWEARIVANMGGNLTVDLPFEQRIFP